VQQQSYSTLSWVSDKMGDYSWVNCLQSRTEGVLRAVPSAAV